jgi:cytochrome c biogenesis factor
MMAEAGHFALLSALILTSCAIPADLVGKWSGSARLMRTGRDATILSFGCLSIAIITLVIALISGDFDIVYVARHTSSASSFGHKISALCAGPGGSLLFWLWAQAGFVATVFCECIEDHRKFCANARVAANLVCVFFLLGVTFEINPFAVSDPVSPNGAALDRPLAHLILLIGYAASAAPCAWSFAWLKWDNAQGPAPLFRQVRYWILLAWLFLTVATVVGAWLAYEQLGSEGRSFRDVAQNVSLMPWLPATALLCGSRIFKRDDTVAKWIVPLSLITFSSCILATFVGRADMPAGARRLFIILLIHIWVLAVISLWRRYRRSKRPDKT